MGHPDGMTSGFSIMYFIDFLFLAGFVGEL